MKTNFFLLLCGFFLVHLSTFAQSNEKEDIKIKVLEEEFMYAKASVEEKKLPKIQILFTHILVKVLIPHQDRVITLEIVNTDCKAYCPRVKRIRQLTPKDDKLLLNVIEKEKNNIIAQLIAKGWKL